MQLLILSLVIVGAMGAPVVLTPSGLAFQSSSGGFPTLLSAGQVGQLIQAPAALTQDTSVAESFSLRDPNNPTTDVVLHSGFPFVAASLSQPQAISSSAQSSQLSQFSSPLTLSAPLTRVGINTVGNAVQSAHLASIQAPVQPQPSPLVQPQLTFTTLQSSNNGVPTFLLPAQAQSQQQQQVVGSGFRTIPLTLAGPFQTVTTN